MEQLYTTLLTCPHHYKGIMILEVLFAVLFLINPSIKFPFFAGTCAALFIISQWEINLNINISIVVAQ